MLQPIAPDLFHAEYELWSSGIRFHTRMFVARLSDGSVLLASPIPLEDDLVAAIDALGPVRHIAAPSLFHHLFVKRAKARYPDARLYGVKGFAEKRADIPWDVILDGPLPAPLDADFDSVCLMGGPRAAEHVWFHRATKTLVLTDLCFNVKHEPHWLTRLLFKMVGAHGRCAQSRLWRFVTKDRAAAAAACDRILAWDFDRLVMAHGDILEDQPRQRLAEAFAWMRGGNKALP